MAIRRSRALGSLVINLEFDDNSCIPNTKQELYEEIIEDLSVELPSGDQDVFVVVSPNAPEDRSKIWLQTAVDRFPQSVNIWNGTTWIQLLGFGVDFPRQFLGNPDNPPPGWTTYNAESGIDLSGSFINLPNNRTLYYAYFTG